MSSFLKTIGPPKPMTTKEPVAKKKQEPKKQPAAAKKRRRKQKIPAALREQVWIHRMGRVFEGKCLTTWCQNTITVFDFQSGHDIPESKGGPTTLENLYPLCSRCNLSMGDTYTYQQWCNISNMPKEEKPALVEMTPKLMPDEDGDVPPCSVMHSYKSAKEWDAYKQKKYQGKQKAISVVKQFRKNRWADFLYKWFKISIRS